MKVVSNPMSKTRPHLIVFGDRPNVSITDQDLYLLKERLDEYIIKLESRNG